MMPLAMRSPKFSFGHISCSSTKMNPVLISVFLALCVVKIWIRTNSRIPPPGLGSVGIPD